MSTSESTSENPPEIEQHDAGDIFIVEHKPGETFFALLLAASAIFLLSQIGTQTKWVKGMALLQQPRFWPAICLIGFLIFAVGYLVVAWRELKNEPQQTFFPPLSELFYWLRPLEYAAYFMAYVYCVPWLGYLPTTMLFCPLLCLRAGYRSPKILGMSVLMGVVIVLIFKTFLQVKIPGGELYTVFPDSIRNFMISYF